MRAGFSGVLMQFVFCHGYFSFRFWYGYFHLCLCKQPCARKLFRCTVLFFGTFFFLFCPEPPNVRNYRFSYRKTHAPARAEGGAHWCSLSFGTVIFLFGVGTVICICVCVGSFVRARCPGVLMQFVGWYHFFCLRFWYRFFICVSVSSLVLCRQLCARTLFRCIDAVCWLVPLFLSSVLVSFFHLCLCKQPCARKLFRCIDAV